MCLLWGMFAFTILRCFLTPPPPGSFTQLFFFPSFSSSLPLSALLSPHGGAAWAEWQVDVFKGLIVALGSSPPLFCVRCPPSVKLSSGSPSRPC